MFGKHRHGEKRVRSPFMRLTIKLTLMLVIFSAGGVTGTLYGLNLAFSKMREHAEHINELPDTVIPKLADDLALKGDQLAAFDEAFRRHHAVIAQLESENSVAVHQEFYELGKEIMPILNAEQAAEFKETLRKVCTVFLPPLANASDESIHHCPELWK